MNPSELVVELGILLRALQLPLALESPTDLTPSLLIAILECVLAARLPLSAELRTALSSRSRDAQIQCMKIFLGVVEADILKRDVGLSGIDPRKLASGDWAEVVYVGELLCNIGREMGITDRILPPGEARELQAWRLTPSTVAETTISHLSSSSLPTADTSASLHDFDHLRSFQTTSISSQLSPLVFPPTRRATDIQDAATVDSDSHFIRYSGYIQAADEDFELRSFESNRSSITSSSQDGSRSVSEWELSTFSELEDSDPQAQTLFLLQQRAFLLRELAKYYKQ